MALKMAVKARDVLAATERHETLVDAVGHAGCVVATTSRRGVSGVQTPADLAPELERMAAQGHSVAVVFGNEKTGLDDHELALAHVCLRIPMAADQPSLNLAQAVQLVAYELFRAALARRP